MVRQWHTDLSRGKPRVNGSLVCFWWLVIQRVGSPALLIRIANRCDGSKIAFDRTYIQRPICIIHTPTNNPTFMHKDTSNGHFVWGKSLLCLSRSVRYLHTLYIIGLAYHSKGGSHILLMLLVTHKPILLLRFNLNVINPHNNQFLMSRS